LFLVCQVTPAIPQPPTPHVRGHTDFSLHSVGDFAMKTNHETIKVKELAHHENRDLSPLVFGLAMTAVFATMLILNAIFY